MVAPLLATTLPQSPQKKKNKKSAQQQRNSSSTPRHSHEMQRRPPKSSAPLLGPRAWGPLRTARMLFQRRSLSGGWKVVSVAQTTRHPCILAGKHGHASQVGKK